jgi:hypothetical protein
MIGSPGALAPGPGWPATAARSNASTASSTSNAPPPLPDRDKEIVKELLDAFLTKRQIQQIAAR